MMAARLEVSGVDLAYGETPVLSGIDFKVEAGEFVGLIGPNACGKSTLLRAVSRVLRPVSGRILLNGRDLWRELSLRETSRLVAVVPQDFPANFPFTVQETVMMGRLPYVSRLKGERPEDLARTRRAMEATGTAHLAHRPLAELAGGDRQRVVVAKALAQDPELLLLDEPTSHLDINHQVEILDLLLRLNRTEGLTIVIVLHDLNLASMYCRRLLLLAGGSLAAEGPPSEVLTVANLEKVYGSRVLVGRHPVYGCPQVTLLSQLRAAASAVGAGTLPDMRGGREAPADEPLLLHVVGGGGSSAGLLESLAAAGYRVTAGPLNAGDSDWEMARALGVETLTVPPFSPVDREAVERAAAMMREADAVLAGPVPYGRGNVGVLEAVAEAVKRGVPVGLVGADGEAVARRDFSGGRAAALVRTLVRDGAVPLRDEGEALAWVANLRRRRSGAVGS
ncbi:MAG TPA: heme ABC transporter ATP-binding protein [Clostridiales bacterium]|nr:heme ABC transporter ATP-binding protein [Clostridiales bacterium]